MSAPWYVIEVSNHPQAGARISTQAASESWEQKYAGTIATAQEARHTVDELAKWYRHARAFRGRDIGRLWYASYALGDGTRSTTRGVSA